MKIQNIFLTLLLLFFLSSGFIFSSLLGGGHGTKEDPFRIYTKEHLEELAELALFPRNTNTDPFTRPLPST